MLRRIASATVFPLHVALAIGAAALALGRGADVGAVLGVVSLASIVAVGSLHAMFLPSWCQSEIQSATVAYAARWTTDMLDAALDEARALVRSDGADLILVEADAGTARIVLRLDVGDESCATGACVMPGEMLRPLIADVLARRLHRATDL